MATLLQPPRPGAGSLAHRHRRLFNRLVEGSVPQLSSETQSVLRTRLRAAALVLFLVCAAADLWTEKRAAGWWAERGL